MTLAEKLARRDLLKQLGMATTAALAAGTPRLWADSETFANPPAKADS